MRNFIILTVVLVTIGIEGLFGYQYLNTMVPSTPSSLEKTLTIRTGVVQKLSTPGDDFTHTLQAPEGLIKLNSYAVKLDEYANTTVTVIGEYSGDTLYVDSAK